MNILQNAITWLLTKQSEVKKSMTTKLAIAILVNSQPADGVSQNSVQITATDDAGAPVAGVTLNLAISAGVGGLPATSGITDANGVLTVPVLSSTVGQTTITATSSDGGSVTDSSLYFVAVAPAVALTGMDGVHGYNQSATVDIQTSALAALKASFEKKLQFIESAIEVLGADAEQEIVSLAEKYL